jgi:primary-amine oxidase
MKYERTFIDSESDGKLNWDVNNAVMYSVVNKEARNKHGEYRGWKISPGR